MAKTSPLIRNIRKVKRRSASRETAMAPQYDPREPQDQGDSHLPPYSGDFNALQRQIYMEYNLAWNFMRPKISEWLVRLKLYNNQRREKDKVGDPTMYKNHQAILARLVSDQLNVNFVGRDDDEIDQASNLNILADNDYEEMEKEVLDYEWDWDASFFGSSLCLMNDFDVESKTPVPKIIDPTTFIRNPGAKSVNGNRGGEGQMIFGGYEVRLTRAMMEANPKTESNPYGYFNLDKLIKTNDLFSLSGESNRLRREAQGLNDIFTFENALQQNFEYAVLRWFTHIGPKKYIVEVANNRMLVVRVIPLKTSYWPIIQRKFSPIAHDWDGVSVPDFTEDKQRMMASMTNTAADLVKADLNGMWLFHEDRFRRTQDFNFKFGKWIPVKGPGPLGDAAAPLQTKQISPSAQYILNYLQSSAAAAMATSDMEQGQPPTNGKGGAPTLGQANLQVAGSSAQHSLTAKVFGWSEREFWRQWYFNYAENFDSALGTKIAALEGPLGPKWVPIKRKDIISGNSLGPRIRVESKEVSEARKVRTYMAVQNYAQIALQDPDVDKTYLLRYVGEQVMPKRIVERIIPPTVDEIKAKEENEKLGNNQKVVPQIADDHKVHMRVHDEGEYTPAMWLHIKLHQYLFMQQRTNPAAFPQMNPQQQQTPLSLNAGSSTPNQNPGQITPPEGATQ